MPEIRVGDVVEIVNDFEQWNGTRAKVVAIRPEADTFGRVYPYELVALTDTTSGHRKAEENIGRWTAATLKRLNTPVDDAVASFPRRLDVFYSPTTGGAVVMTPIGSLVRILPDGTIDQ